MVKVGLKYAVSEHDTHPNALESTENNGKSTCMIYC